MPTVPGELALKVLVTGATGFVGTWIVEAWLAGGHEVRALVRDRQKAADVLDASVDVVTGDALDPATMERALEGRDILVHGAAAYRYGRGLGDEMQITAPALARTAFEAAKRSGTSHVIDISSAVVFAPHTREGGRLVTDVESPAWPRDDIRWRDPYLASKALAHEEAERARAEGMPISSVHPCLVLGPRDRGPGVSGGLLRSLITDRVIVDALVAWVDVRDVADVVIGVAGRAPGASYLAAATTFSLRDAAGIIGRVTGTSRRHLWSPPGMVRAMAALNDRAGGRLLPGLPDRPSVEFVLGDKGVIDGSTGAAALGRPYRPFEETVRDTVSWWAANGMLTRAQAGRAASQG